MLRSMPLVGVLVVVWGVGLLSCGSRSEPVQKGMAPLWRPPAGMVEEAFVVPGSTPPPNPEAPTVKPPIAGPIGARVIAVRAADVTEPELVVVTVPGVYAGANNFRTIAYDLIGRTQGRVAVWMTERRANLLEDLTGLDAAEAEAVLDPVWSYYDGDTFPGFYTSQDLRFLSEWGMGVHFADLVTVIAEVRRRHPGARVVWMGHSMGSMWAQAFVRYDLDCDPATPERGADLLDGLVLLDGAVAPVLGFGATGPTERAYLDGLPLVLGGATLSTLGLRDLRRGTELITDLGAPALFWALEVAALATRLAPDLDLMSLLAERVPALRLLESILYGGEVHARPSAVLGLLLDDDHEPVRFARFRMGYLRGPATEGPNPLEGLAGTLWFPGDPDHLYGWEDRSERSGAPPWSRVTEVATAFYAGPANFLEWYMPLRLVLDLDVVLAYLLEPHFPAWAWSYGLCLQDPAPVPLPILAVAAEYGVAPTAGAYGPWLSLHAVSDTTTLELAAHNHLDMLVAATPDRNPLLPALAAWAARFLR